MYSELTSDLVVYLSWLSRLIHIANVLANKYQTIILCIGNYWHRSGFVGAIVKCNRSPFLRHRAQYWEELGQTIISVFWVVFRTRSERYCCVITYTLLGRAKNCWLRPGELQAARPTAIFLRPIDDDSVKRESNKLRLLPLRRKADVIDDGYWYDAAGSLCETHLCSTAA